LNVNPLSALLSVVAALSAVVLLSVVVAALSVDVLLSAVVLLSVEAVVLLVVDESPQPARHPATIAAVNKILTGFFIIKSLFLN
jgi:hypothetical protein